MDPLPRFDLDDPDALWFCARCGAAYARMPRRCEECGGTEFLPRADAERLAARATGDGEEAGEAVVLVETRHPLARARIAALLEQGGIRFVVENIPPAAMPYRGERPDARFVVAREDLSRARAALEAWREEQERAALEEPWEVSVSGEELSPGEPSRPGQMEPEGAGIAPSPPVVTGHRYAVPGSRRALAVSCGVAFLATVPLVHPLGLFLMDGRTGDAARLFLALAAAWAGLLFAVARPGAGLLAAAAAWGFLAFTTWDFGVDEPLLFAIGALGLAGAALTAPPGPRLRSPGT